MSGKRSFEPKKILCPVDFSALSDLALNYAAAGAREYTATLIILHAQTFDLPRYFKKDLGDHLIEELDAAKQHLRDHLVQHVEKLLQSKGPFRYEIRDVHPVEAILETADGESCDLIVMGTHGISGIRRFLLGSVTENVVANAKIPVFTIRHKEYEIMDVNRSDGVVHISKILCPVNATGGARKVLQQAASLAEQFDARLTVLHSLESGSAADSEARLNDWINTAVTTKLSVTSVVRQGNAPEQIVAYAREERQDLIVIGALRQSFLEGDFYGRTTELVLRYAPVPVLVIPVFPDG